MKIKLTLTLTLKGSVSIPDHCGMWGEGEVNESQRVLEMIPFTPVLSTKQF